MSRRKLPAVTLILAAAVLLFAGDALASSAGMPWEGPLNRLLQSLTGPVAKAVGVFSIVGLGFGIAFSEGGSGLRKALWVVLGLAIAFSATSFFLSFMGFSGGLAV
jgi:type IV secretion system protein VirB2